MNKSSRSAVALAIVVIGIFRPFPAQAEVADMFSFFGKGDKGTINTIAPAVGAELKPESGMPADQAFSSPSLRCRKMRFEGSPPNTQFEEDVTIDTPRSAFFIDGKGKRPPLALINNPDNNRFDVWTLATGSLQPSQQMALGKLRPDQDRWVAFYVVGAACLNDRQALLAINEYNPRPTHALYVLDLESSHISHLVDVESDAQNPLAYFQFKPITPDTSLVLYFSDMRRESAEVYHNYYNHFLLFSPNHPHGLEILKLGIDTGNVNRWKVVDRTLYLDTIDTRGDQPPKRGMWSLSLAKLLD